MAKALFVTLLYYLFGALTFFLSAGRIDLPLAWLYIVTNALLGIATVLILAKRDPALLQERLKPGPGEHDKIYKVFGTVCYFVLFILAGLDVGRRHWSPAVSPILQLFALLLDIGGLVFMLWAMMTNAFFSSAVRLQPDRNQVLITSGPYRFMRHPGYTGGILYLIFSGLALGSWWAGLTVLPMLVLTIRRTLLEDALLQRGLPGYAEYAAKVPFRLLPHVW
jgi:protein-S-isoprenylcysteine O-methyltransferase Ste14